MAENISIIGLVMFIVFCALIGSLLAPTIAQAVGTAQADTNITGASNVLIGLSTLMYALVVMLSVASPTVYLMRLIM